MKKEAGKVPARASSLLFIAKKEVARKQAARKDLEDLGKALASGAAWVPDALRATSKAFEDLQDFKHLQARPHAEKLSSEVFFRLLLRFHGVLCQVAEEALAAEDVPWAYLAEAYRGSKARKSNEVALAAFAGLAQKDLDLDLLTFQEALAAAREQGPWEEGKALEG